jgi:starch phosphorylase
LVEKFFWQYWGQLGIDRDRFIGFAAQDLPWGPQYSMTVLALRLSAFANGVSKLHGEVSREMWNFLWPDTPVAQVPIGHITNGVHTKTWLARELRSLYSQYLGADWLEEVDNPSTWAAIAQVPDAELWAVHEERKRLMVEHVRERIKRQYLRYGEGPRRIKEAEGLLNPHALTLGFARRFATYKRATLIFKDEARLLKLLNDPDRPVQIVFSGKAHPADEPGKALIQQIYHLSQRPEFSGKIVFVENYDMNIARHLVAGVDVWLNTPRRPHEASGTSGEKAALCGSPNFSVLDGWWVEGYDGENGWSIGEEREYKDEATQDDADVQDLYTTLEESIIPLYYTHNGNGIPSGWVAKMKNAIRSCAPQFSMRRMIKEYTENYYLPAAAHGKEFSAENYALARELAGWKAQLGQRWQALQLQAEAQATGQLTVGEVLQVRAKLWLNGVEEAQVAVELIAGQQTKTGVLIDPLVVPMQAVGHDNGAVIYEGALTPKDSGVLSLGVRARPVHQGLINPNEIALSRWA